MELLARKSLLSEKNREAQSVIRAKCKADPLFFINYFCWTYDPRPNLDLHDLPFVLYPFQEETLTWMEERYSKVEDGLIEKSRDMGVSWLVLAFVLHKWLFVDGFTALLGSRKEDLVDNKNADSLFGKLDYMIKRLPGYLLPPGFDLQKHRTFAKITDPVRENSIIGESTNQDFARSGRYSLIFLDEFAFVENSWSIWRASRDSSPVRFAVSTPNGKGNKFYELRKSESIAVRSLHWTLHPNKDKAWYEKECSARTPEEIAQELDISYERSTRGQVYLEELQFLRANGRITKVSYQPGLRTYASIDFGIGDATVINWFQIDSEGLIYWFDSYENSGKAIDHYIEVIQDRPYWQETTYYGDIAGEQRTLASGNSAAARMRSAGIYVRSRPVKKSAKFKNNTVSASKILLRKTFINEDLKTVLDALENYHYAFNERDNSFSDLPVHNWASHCCDSFQYFAWNLRIESEPAPKVRVSEYDPLMTTSF